jgi:hypothetical protein
MALLDRALAIATQALIAEHPTLANEMEPGRAEHEPPTLREARRLLGAIPPLRRALARYCLAVCRALVPSRTDDDDLPF